MGEGSDFSGLKSAIQGETPERPARRRKCLVQAARFPLTGRGANCHHTPGPKWWNW